MIGANFFSVMGTISFCSMGNFLLHKNPLLVKNGLAVFKNELLLENSFFVTLSKYALLMNLLRFLLFFCFHM